jgi:hypothetical protein
MVETDFFARIVDLLQDGRVQLLPIKSITALAKFGRLMYHFVLCED